MNVLMHGSNDEHREYRQTLVHFVESFVSHFHQFKIILFTEFINVIFVIDSCEDNSTSFVYFCEWSSLIKK